MVERLGAAVLDLLLSYAARTSWLQCQGPPREAQAPRTTGLVAQAPRAAGVMLFSTPSPHPPSIAHASPLPLTDHAAVARSLARLLVPSGTIELPGAL